MSSAEDLATYFSAVMGVHPSGDAVVSARTRTAVETPGAPAGSFSYGLGWRNGTTAGVPSLWHGGALAHYRGALVISPSERWGVIVLSNLGSHFGDHTRSIAAGITARLFNKSNPAEIASLKSISRLSGIPVALWLASLLWKLARMNRWRTRVAPKLEERRFRRRLVVRTSAGFLWPIAFVVFLPMIIGLPFRAVYEALPDLTLGVAVVAVLEMTLALLRLRFIDVATRASRLAERGAVK